MSALLEIRDLNVHFPVPRGVADLMVGAPRQAVSGETRVTALEEYCKQQVKC